MSSIEKLAIVGIRSFSPQTQNVIEFGMPLTIILGVNGAGKTTIIECLKYATTGELPPNGGTVFVHDPNLSDETDVTAQVKMKFKNIKQETMIVSRSVLVTKKKKKTEFKTMENSLKMVDENNSIQQGVSIKGKEIDYEIETSLGVSKAILESVIFCHQEDTSWPLSSSSILKKKFDDIFEATKYIKALEFLKKIRKEKALEAKTELQKFEFLKTDKERADKIIVSKDVVSTNIQTLDFKIKKIETELEEYEKQISNRKKKLDAFSENSGTLFSLKKELDFLHVQRKDFSPFTLVNGTIEELTSVLQKKTEMFSFIIQQKERLIEREKELTKENQLFIKKTSEEVYVQIGIKKAEFRMKTKEKNIKKSRIDVLQEQFGVSKQEPIEFCDFLRNKKFLFKEKLDTLTENRIQLEKKVKKQLQEILSQSAVKKVQIKNKQEFLEKTKIRLEELFSEMSEEKKVFIEEIRNRLSISEKRLLLFSFETKNKGLEDKEKEIKKKLKEYEDNVFSLNKQVMELKDQSELIVLLSLKENEFKKKENYFIENKKRTQGNRKVFSIAEWEKQIKESLNMSEELEKENERLNTEEAVVITKNKILQKELEEKVFETKEETQEEKEQLFKEEKELIELLQKTNPEGETKAYSEYILFCKQKKQCPLCNRNFLTAKEISSFIGKLESRLIKDIKETDKQKEQQEIINKKLIELKKRLFIINEKEKIKEKIIPSIKEQKQQYEKRLFKLKEEKEKVQSLREKQSLKRKLFNNELEYMKKNEILENEIEEIKADVCDLNRKIGNKKIDNYKEFLSLLENKMLLLNQTREEFKENSLLKERLNEDFLEIKRIFDKEKEEEKAAVISIEKGKQASQEHASLLKQVTFIEKEIKEFMFEIEEECLIVKQEENVLEKRMNEINKEIEYIRNSMFDIEKVITEVERLSLETESIDENGLNLKEEIKELEKLFFYSEKEIERKKKEIDQLKEEVVVLEKDIFELNEDYKSIEASIKFKKISLQIDNVSQNIFKLEKNLKIDFDLLEEKEKLSKHEENRSRLLQEKTGLLGEKKQLQNRFLEYEKELKRDYNLVNEQYHEQYIRIKLNETALSDLIEYEKALDTSIMKYHSIKMQDINKIIKELWEKTYKGTDIDAIEIKTEKESETSKTYNYRVVMIKENVSIDMRGRSSAGQRALASLIIRLALAETFGINCGIFALDEPTTNLDRENIEGLVSSLVEIIELRRKQKNFQFIIITHDEDFVNALCSAGELEHYWKVSMNENKNSIIERNDFFNNQI